jgi:nicotinate-nucleotide adenylyltransferase
LTPVKLGLFGGSFDPIHAGHILPIRQARQALGLDQVIYLPTAKPPHKARRDMAPAHSRYAMVEMALLEEEGLYASPHELTLDRPAYTVETLEHFRATTPEADLYLILGGDSFADLHKWVRWRDIIALARIVVLTRPGWDLDETLYEDLAEAVTGAGDGRSERNERFVFLRQPPVDISSTRLRELFQRDEPVPPGVMPDLVVRFVQKYGLYR